ncbi:MAG TPA: lysophospholipid acyltransferase family protein [Gemmatimonadales bacterium]|nr:lysophospholipid acyltransferase family protein [Gemmatimonadales bacterium]
MLRNLWSTIASLWTWFILGMALLVWLPLMAVVRLATAPFDKGRYLVGRLFRQIARVTVIANPLWRFRTAGQVPANPRRPFVVVSNHESFTDILLISLLPWEMKWMSKIEMFRLPVLGWDMWLAGDIPVERGERRSAVAALLRCREVLGRKVSVMIFPEGTRTLDGEMLPFKDGAFRLAIDCGVPILPLALVGTRTALRKHDWRFSRAIAEVRVLEPVETAGLTVKDVPQLREQVRQRIMAARDEMRRSHTAQGEDLPEE